MTVDDPSQAPPGIPAEAAGRLEGGPYTSGLSVPEFAACLHMGLEPVGLVQGFCVMQWGWYGAGSSYGRGASPRPVGEEGRSTYGERWACPHGFVSAEHRSWGQNFEQTWVEEAWSHGFGTAFQRLLEEATDAGAHGVIGVTDTERHLADTGVIEFRVTGTAVRVEGGAPPPGGRPWTTYLAGQHLAKLIEVGLMPVSIVAAMSSVRVWAYCQTEFLMEGQAAAWGGGGGVTEIDQVSRAHGASRSLVRDRVREQLGPDELHGARAQSWVTELGQGDQVVESTLRGTRVRKFKAVDPIAPPLLAVSLR